MINKLHMVRYRLQRQILQKKL